MDSYPLYLILKRVLSHCGLSDFDLQAAAQEVAKTIPKVRRKEGQLLKDLTLTDRFEVFWKAYPKKKCKGDARKAWLVLHPDDALLERMLRTVEVERRSKTWQEEEGKWIPYPASWLRAECWEDEASVDLTIKHETGKYDPKPVNVTMVTINGKKYAKAQTEEER